MAELPEELRPKPGDMPSRYSRQPGQKGCFCSRCLSEIGEDCFPIMYFAEKSKVVFRYHPECLGIETFDDDDDYLE